MDKEKEKLRHLLERFRMGMLVTHGRAQGGALHSRPMAVSDLDDALDVWFVTDKASGKAFEIEANQDVQVLFQDKSVFVAMTGAARIVEDRAKIDELWNPHYEAWFPQGKDDPNLVLIHVETRDAEYWDQSGGKRIAYFAQVVKALATGKRPRTENGDQHGKARV